MNQNKYITFPQYLRRVFSKFENYIWPIGIILIQKSIYDQAIKELECEEKKQEGDEDDDDLTEQEIIDTYNELVSSLFNISKISDATKSIAAMVLAEKYKEMTGKEIETENDACSGCLYNRESESELEETGLMYHCFACKRGYKPTSEPFKNLEDIYINE